MTICVCGDRCTLLNRNKNDKKNHFLSHKLADKLKSLWNLRCLSLKTWNTHMPVTLIRRSESYPSDHGEVIWRIDTVLMEINNNKPTVSYLICKILSPINNQHDQNFAEKHVVHNLPHAFCCLVVHTLLKKPFSIILHLFTFRLWFTCLLAMTCLLIFTK